MSDSSENLAFGDIVWLEFPFTDGKGKKHRPTVVVSSVRLNKVSRDVTLMPITSQDDRANAYGVLEIRDHKASGLSKPSFIKPIFASVEKGRIKGTSGSLDPLTISYLRNLLPKILS